MLAVIGGTGLEQLDGLSLVCEHNIETPYGRPSAAIQEGEIAGKRLYFLSRHAADHSVAPHLINYRANIWALKELGVIDVLSIAAVGGVSEANGPRVLNVPDQIIDYTWGREHTFVEAGGSVNHIDFTYPYTEAMRQRILRAADAAGINVVDGGIYAATQGPRLETAAEIARFKRDGCDIVGMTGMPEAALAREAGINYAVLAVVANWGAGILPEEISLEEIYEHLRVGTQFARQILVEILKAY